MRPGRESGTRSIRHGRPGKKLMELQLSHHPLRQARVEFRQCQIDAHGARIDDQLGAVFRNCPDDGPTHGAWGRGAQQVRGTLAGQLVHAFVQASAHKTGADR
jgi:hypothetical protein